MRRVVCVALVLLVLAVAGACVSTALGSQSPTVRDLYTSYDGAQQGRPGVKVSVRLMRDGKERSASVGEQFYSGDRIKLSLDTNFTGYVAVVNTGPTGSQTLLYPQADDAVFPAGSGVTLPPAEDKWIVFDDNAGDERLALIFSANPLQLRAQQAEHRPATATAPQTPQQQSGEQSEGGLSERHDALSAMAELNSRAITRGRDRAASRDMFTEAIGANTYTVVSQDALTDPVGVELVLRHAKR